MNLLGRCLEEGWGCEPDRVAAALWYERSAQSGYFRGQFNYAAVLAQHGHARRRGGVVFAGRGRWRPRHPRCHRHSPGQRRRSGADCSTRRGCRATERRRRPPGVSPETQPESSDARNTATLATSSGWPRRPSGVVARMFFSKSLPMIPWAWVPSVTINPGLMELTRILRGPNSLARIRVMVSTDDLVAA